MSPVVSPVNDVFVFAAFFFGLLYFGLLHLVPINNFPYKVDWKKLDHISPIGEAVGAGETVQIFYKFACNKHLVFGGLY